jgi:hypothetical protein
MKTTTNPQLSLLDGLMPSALANDFFAAVGGRSELETDRTGPASDVSGHDRAPALSAAGSL